MTEGGDWIDDAVKRPGAFSAKAKERDLTTTQFAAKVTKNPDEYDTRTVRQANLAKTLTKLRNRKKG
jgi:hypothetical protein